MSNSFTSLPTGLPVPQDDGACDHLPGMAVPSVKLRSSSGEWIDLSSVPGTTIAYIYPMTGTPGVALPPGWDDIPGARGCTPETCGFRDHAGEFAALGATIFGISSQAPAEQTEFATRMKLPFQILSDEKLLLASALRLPTFDAAGITRIKRLTLILRGGLIEKVFYPIFPSDLHAAQVVEWFSTRA